MSWCYVGQTLWLLLCGGIKENPPGQWRWVGETWCKYGLNKSLFIYTKSQIRWMDQSQNGLFYSLCCVLLLSAPARSNWSWLNTHEARLWSLEIQRKHIDKFFLLNGALPSKPVDKLLYTIWRCYISLFESFAFFNDFFLFSWLKALIELKDISIFWRTEWTKPHVKQSWWGLNWWMKRAFYIFFGGKQWKKAFNF